jgi:hypothetical protein
MQKHHRFGSVHQSLIAFFFAILVCYGSSAAVNVTVNAQSGRLPISPYIYGKNNNFSDDPANPTSAANIALYKAAGLRMSRDNGGNNCTKYNWRKKLSSHPDWYNNVYAHDWGFASQNVQSRMPGVSLLWALQLLGKVARTDSANFDCWNYNQCQWTADVSKNWCGNGDITKYLVDWPADSDVGIFQNFFSPVSSGGLGLDSTLLRYWNMDNEPEIWNSTHDDVVTAPITAEDYLARYFAVAKAARARFPGIKLVGPVFTNEWQWWAWNNTTISGRDGNVTRNFCWLEYFIKRVAEEQAASGVRLLDVLDFHFYPGTSNDHDITQLHRVWFDTTYNYPGANGCKLVSGSWDNNQTREFVMERSRRWLAKYMGANNNVGFSVSEHGALTGSANAIAVWYASALGTFADQGATIFTPWDWYAGQWEVMHLFTTAAKSTRVLSTSDLDTMVSAYSSINATGDSLTIILVNRFPSAAQTAQIAISGFTPQAATDSVFEISGLPATETFTATSNALKHKSVAVSGTNLSMNLPAFSISAIVLKGTSSGVANGYTAVTSPEKHRPGLIGCTDLRGRTVFTVRSDVLDYELRIMMKKARVAGCFILRNEVGTARKIIVGKQ